MTPLVPKNMGDVEPVETAIFLHVQKTGGTTLHRILERQYPEDQIYSFDAWNHTFEHFTNLSEGERSRIRLLRGHMVFGMHEYVPNPSTYFTLLRDPVDRVISYYYHVLRDHNHHWHDFVVSNDVGLRAFVESGKDIGMSDFQTRVLAGGRWHNSPYGKCPREAVKVAQRHLQDHFSVVGLLRRFDETLLMLGKASGWQDLCYVRRNVTRQRPDKRDLPRGTLKAIVNANRRDIELYSRVSEYLVHEVRKRGPVFAVQTRLFCWWNRWTAKRRALKRRAAP